MHILFKKRILYNACIELSNIKLSHLKFVEFNPNRFNCSNELLGNDVPTPACSPHKLEETSW